MEDLPDPDFLNFIRTGGEVRLSNFLLMQISYSELYIFKTRGETFKERTSTKRINNFRARKRRFGA